MSITLNTNKLNIKNTNGTYIPITAVIEEGNSGEGSGSSEISYDMSQINEAVAEATSAAESAQNAATSAATSATNAANAATSAANAATNVANNATTNINTAINNANLAKDDALSAAQTANVAAQAANTAVANITSSLNQVKQEATSAAIDSINSNMSETIASAIDEAISNNESFNTSIENLAESKINALGTELSQKGLGTLTIIKDEQIPWISDGTDGQGGSIVNKITTDGTYYIEEGIKYPNYWLTPPPSVPGSIDFRSPTWKYSDFIEINENVKIIYFNTTAPDNTEYNAFYTEATSENNNEPQFIENFIADGPVIVPKNAKYFRLSLAQAYKVSYQFDYYVSLFLDYSNVLFTRNYDGIKEIYPLIQQSDEGNIVLGTKKFEIINTNNSNSNANFLYELLYTYNDTITEGDVYTINAKYIAFNPDTSPFSIYLYTADNEEIRHTYSNSITITLDDIQNNIDRIEFYLYPVRTKTIYNNYNLYKGLFGIGFKVRDITIIKGRATGVDLISDLREAVINTINSPYQLPDYYFKNNYIQNKVNKINKMGKEASDMFIFITDEHWGSNRQLSPALINYLDKNCYIPRLFNGGDTGDGYNEDFINEIRKAFPHKIYNVIGNHEWKQETTGTELYYIMDSYNNDQIGNPEGHYYYVDNVQQGIRYIILNAFKIIKRQKKDANGNPMSDNQNNPIIEYKEIGDYDNNQFNWFEQALENTPPEWDVIIFTHYFGQSTNNEVGFIPLTIDINNPETPNTPDDDTNYTQRYADLMHQFNTNGDVGGFTDRNGKILAIFQGHLHADAIFNTNPPNNGIPIITTTCDKCGRYEQTEEYITEYRETGKISEQAFDVVAIKRNISDLLNPDQAHPNRKKRDITITCERIGAKAMDNKNVCPKWDENGLAITKNDDFNFEGTLETREISLTFDYDP